ncbi:MAG TPA: hypothetical protein VJY62_15520 [Bacteroidia bacterium]|nr:hypothetical protein [Bacteroidia bacterium]
MHLLIAILMCLHLYATTENFNDPAFVQENQQVIDRARTIMDNHWYEEVDGGVVIDEGVTP